MITLRKAPDRFHTEIDWLDSWHTFSFGEHHHPDHMGFRSLRVINDDTVQPGQGFGTHSHQNMEILTYVLQGALAHRDSTGGGGLIKPGDVQRMSAGTGVAHSEFNASGSDPVHFLQIWIVPERQGLKPGYEQKSFPSQERAGKLRLLASRDGQDGSVKINQDAAVYGSLLGAGDRVTYDLAPKRHAFLQVARGKVNLNGQSLSAGDGASVADESKLALQATEPAEVLLFDLA